jgi:hypothetical protein
MRGLGHVTSVNGRHRVTFPMKCEPEFLASESLRPNEVNLHPFGEVFDRLSRCA